jgi:HK97 family phage prohead protease
VSQEFDVRSTDAYDQSPNQRRADLADAEVIQLRDGLMFDGYAAVFDTKTELETPRGVFVEEIRRGAFRRYLNSGANIPFCLEHDTTQLLGTTGSGRVRLTEDQRGLRVSANLADTDLARRVKALVDAGDVKGMSFGFVVGKGNADWSRRNGKEHRTIKDFNRIMDVCTTWDPAYAETEAQFRSLAFAQPQSSDALQQLLTGVYPQLEEKGRADEQPEPIQGGDHQDDDAGAGYPLLAARRRRLQLLTIGLERD